MSVILKMTAPSAAASWLGSGAVARPRPVVGDCPPSGVAGLPGAFGAAASATPVLTVPGAGRTNPIPAALLNQTTLLDQATLPNQADLPQMSTTRTTHRQYRQRFRYWSPPN